MLYYIKTCGKTMKREEREALKYVQDLILGYKEVNAYDMNKLSNFYQQHAINKKMPIDRNDNIRPLSSIIKRIEEIKEELFSSDEIRPALSRPSEVTKFMMLANFLEDSYLFSNMSQAIDHQLKFLNPLIQKNNLDQTTEMAPIKEAINQLSPLREMKEFKEQVQHFFNQFERLALLFKSVSQGQQTVENYNRAFNEFKEIALSPDQLYNEDRYQSIEQFNEYFKINENLDHIRFQRDKLIDKIALDFHDTTFNMADDYRYHNHQKSPDLGEFIEKKVDEEELNKNLGIRYHLKTNKAFVITDFIIFEDASLLVKDNKNNIRTIRDDTDGHLTAKLFFQDYADFKLRKHPTIAKFFREEFSSSIYRIESMMLAIDTYLNNINILKQNNFDITDYKGVHFERVDDKMHSIIEDHKIKQYAHAISSNKYEHLYNNETYEIFRELYDKKIETSYIQDNIGRKIAAFKTPEEFNNALMNVYDRFNDLTLQKIEIKAREEGIEIISSADNKLYLKIENFEQSKALGSSSWCIARDDYYFDSYTREGKNQYFLYDFNKNSKDNSSLIGITLDRKGDHYASHYRNDDQLDDSDLREAIISDILNYDKAYKISEKNKINSKNMKN